MRLIRLKEVMRLTGLGRTSIYKFMAEERFPKQVSLGGRVAAWVESEIEEWLQDKINIRDSVHKHTTNKPQEITEGDMTLFIKKKLNQLTVGEVIEWVLSIAKTESKVG